jgi:hypothetical protein
MGQEEKTPTGSPLEVFARTHYDNQKQHIAKMQKVVDTLTPSMNVILKIRSVKNPSLFLLTTETVKQN